MLEIAMPSFKLAQLYAQKLAADVPDERMCDQPVAGRTMNHAAFLLGHIAWANDSRAAALDGQPPALADWKETFGMGAVPQADRAKYPAKDVLLAKLAAADARLAAAVAKAKPEDLAQPSPEKIRDRFPTVGNMVLGLMTSHYSNHLGQLSAWRRAPGYPSVF